MVFDILTKLFWFIVLLGPIVFIHEFGHFLAAKLSGIRVLRFSIGFPPRLFGRKIGDTDYCISATPLGGYCKMAGMIDESLDSENVKGEAWEFMSKPIPVRMFVLFTGPLANFIMAVILYAGLVFFTGLPIAERDDSSIIGEVTIGAAAERAGLKAGDRIIAIDDSEVSTWNELSEIISSRPLETVVLKIDRSGEMLVKEVTIEKRDNPTDDRNEEVGMLGIIQGYTITDVKEVGFFASIGYGFNQSYFLAARIADAIKTLISGRESLKSLGGPVMIAKLTDDMRKKGVEAFISWMAFISLNLGLMNLLPIPGLDGGHLMILSAEGIARRQFPIKAKLIIQQIGMAIILALFIVIFYNDFIRLFSS